MLPRHARCVLSRLRCNGHSLLSSSYLSRIGRMENLSRSTCGHSSLSNHSALSSYGLFAPDALWRLCLFMTSGPDLGELPSFWGSMVFRHSPISRKGSGNNNNLGHSLPSETTCRKTVLHLSADYSQRIRNVVHDKQFFWLLMRPLYLAYNN